LHLAVISNIAANIIQDRIQVSGTDIAMASLSSSLLYRMVLVAAASALLMMSAGTARADGELQCDFYNASCPGVEELVRSELKAKFAADVTLPAALLRLHFHDCFVRGCDASIMLKSHNGTSEQDSDPNSTLRGYEAIEDIKAKIEETCPLVVSCADVMAMAARDAVFFVRLFYCMLCC
jgi:peroxidase